ncbi:MAG: FliA/WhiG family RNA polymerase sigma factor [Verrucomicrobiota bacterium]|nr:FliA/WhiG family RNA polymerase sigma factor [Verrucomicrobiota bacterium]
MKSELNDTMTYNAEAPVIRYSNNGQTVRQDWQKKMIEDNLHLIRHVVERLKLYVPSHYETQDLISIGLLGLISAVLRYDVAKKETFGAYAKMRIRGAIIDELRRQGWRTRRVTLKARQMQEVYNAVEQKLKRHPTDKELAAAMNLSLTEYERWVDETRAVYFVSYSGDGGYGEEGCTMEDAMVDEAAPRPSEKLERADLSELFLKKIQHLPDIQGKVMTMYYLEDMRLAEIAEIFSLTESRICQIHAQAIMTLRSAMRRECLV